MSKAFQSCLPPGGTSDFHYRFLGRAPGRGCHISNEFKRSEVIRSDPKWSFYICHLHELYSEVREGYRCLLSGLFFANSVPYTVHICAPLCLSPTSPWRMRRIPGLPGLLGDALALPAWGLWGHRDPRCYTGPSGNHRNVVEETRWKSSEGINNEI